MKLSKILKPLVTLIFVMAVTYIALSFVPPKYPMYAEFIGVFIIWFISLMIRRMEGRKFNIIFHVLLALAIWFVQFGFLFFRVPLLVFIILYMLLSIITKQMNSDFCNRGTGLNIAIVGILYAMAFVMDKGNMIVIYCFFTSQIIFTYLQNVAVRNEEHLQVISSYSVLNRDDMQHQTNMMTLKIGIIMLVVTIGFGFIGRLQFFNDMMDSFRNLLLKIFKFLQASRVENTSTTVATTSGLPYEVPTSAEEEVTGGNDSVWTIIGIAGFALSLCYIAFMAIYKIVKHKTVYLPDFLEEEKINKDKKDEKKKKKAKKPVDYSYRRAIRRMYKKRIMKGRGARNDDLYAKTPFEHRSKKIEEGYEISPEFIKKYEDVRYSDTEVTREDVRKMKEL